MINWFLLRCQLQRFVRVVIEYKFYKLGISFFEIFCDTNLGVL